MPLYEYRCEKCGHQFERLVSIREAKRGQQCPSCGGEQVRKLMSVCAARVGNSAASGYPTCPTGTCNLSD
jgi:putative FmdB family regulatory protein